MTTAAPTPADKPAGISQEAHTAALATAREEGRKMGRAEAGKILSLDGAGKRPKMAATLAADGDISPEKAATLLAASAEESSGGKLAAAMANHNPTVGSDGGSQDDPKEARRRELQAIGKSMSPQRA
jgi:hypothetical protein